MKYPVAWAMAAIFLTAGAAGAQTSLPAKTQGSYQRIKVHGKALEGNLEGDSADRDVSVYLPASYDKSPNRRYPVIYLLHGYTDSDDRWFGLIQHFINVPVAVDKATAAGAREMILVMPNAYTAFQGSMYSSSLTTGDWESFVAHDLVRYIDSHFRTLADAASRGLAGHSMGGYGTIRIGMKHPEVFSSMYILSPCCMAARMTAQGLGKAEAVKSFDEFAKADFPTKAALASAAAWSPNPKNPPFFFDLPSKNGEAQAEILAKWAANAPLAMLEQYVPSLRRYKAIAMDAGDMDEPIASTVRTLDRMLTSYDLRHTFEIYPGNHVNHIADRVELKMMPFFSENLEFGAAKKQGAESR
jgi:S-formylglutathione hydrolase